MKPSMRENLWMIAGGLLLLAVILVGLYFRTRGNPVELIEFKAQRLELVNRIRLELAAATEAEKSAVLAITDQESERFADQARSATATAEEARQQLHEMLKLKRKTAELKLLEQFSEAFAEFQRVDNEVLGLAVKNTNLKAYSLAFGPAADAMNAMDAALARLPAEDVKVVRMADNARIGARRLQVLLPPHIAEESDQKMDAIEAQMAKEDREVRRSLEDLAALPNLAGNSDLQVAGKSYAQFGKTRAEILKLSRENTNVRSLTLSLTKKRKVMALCQDTLEALQREIQNEPIPGAPPAKPFNPRRL